MAPNNPSKIGARTTPARLGHADDAGADKAEHRRNERQPPHVARKQIFNVGGFIAVFIVDLHPFGGRVGENPMHAGGHVHACAMASARTMAAPFSAIIMVGALVLPEVMVGMTEASITRSRSTPATRKPLVDHHQRVARQPHLGGADRMKDRGADIARRLDERLLVVADLIAGQIFGGMKWRQRRLCDNAPGEPDGADGDAAILVGRQIIRLDRWRGLRIARAQPHLPAARRLDVGNTGGERGKLVQRLAEAIERQRLNMILQIRPRPIGIGSGEQPKLRRRHGQRAAPKQRIFEQHAGKPQRRVVALVQRGDAVDFVDQAQLQMVLQIGADARPVGNDCNAMLLQQLARPNAGHLKDMH